MAQTCGNLTGGYFVVNLADPDTLADYCRIRQGDSVCEFNISCLAFEETLHGYFVNETLLYMPTVLTYGQLHTDEVRGIAWGGQFFYALNAGTLHS